MPTTTIFMEEKFYLYIAECSDDSLYTGITNNLFEREKRHNSGVGSNYTKQRTPVKIVYSETFFSRKQAAQREKQIKGWSKKKKMHLILHGHPNKDT